jgi:hypothetical protein
MPSIPRHTATSALLGLALGLYAPKFTDAAGATSSTPPAESVDAANDQALSEVTVIGKMDAPTLKRAVGQFVQSHAKPGTLSGQIGRWRENVCPTVSGLQRAAREFVSREITSVARSVGAPTSATGKKCTVNIEVVFTTEPQALLYRIAAKYHPLLGYYRPTELKQVTTFSHPVQAWYVTGTRALDYLPPIVGGPFAQPPCPTCDLTAVLVTGLKVDSTGSDGTAGLGASGNPESHLTRGLRSEFMHVLIIVDSNAVARHSVRSLSDYIALLALTHVTSLDSCSGLASIVNLFVADCAEAPAAITPADTAYLKALYAADLDMNLNVEQGDMHERMLQVISSR